MKAFSIFLLVAILCSATFAQEIKIIESGEFHGEEVVAKDGELWYGVYKMDTGYMLLPSILSVSAVHDPIVDSKGEQSGKAVAVPGLGKPVFLVSGGRFNQAGPVKTLRGVKGDLLSESSYEFDLENAKYRLFVASETKSVERFILPNSKLILSNGVLEQEVFSVSECNFCIWQVIWAGDLDGDSKPDFYMLLTDHYNVSRNKLFLSSAAENGKLVKEVAEFVTTGC